MALGQYLTAMQDITTRNSYDFSSADASVNQDLQSSQQWRSAAFDTIDRTGGLNPLKNNNLSMITYAVNVRKRYGGSVLTFQDAWDQLFKVVGRGNILLLTFKQQDGSVRITRGSCIKMDRKDATDNVTWAEIPITILCPDPLLDSATKPGILLADTGLIADTGLLADQDPDKFSVTSNSFTHTANNVYGGKTPTMPDTGGIIRLYGPLTPPIIIYFTSLPRLASGQYQYIGYNLPVAAGEIVTIDGGAGDVTSTFPNVDAYSGLLVPDGQDYWVTVEVGTNIFLVTSAGHTVASKVGIEYAARYG